MSLSRATVDPSKRDAVIARFVEVLGDRPLSFVSSAVTMFTGTAIATVKPEMLLCTYRQTKNEPCVVCACIAMFVALRTSCDISVVACRAESTSELYEGVLEFALPLLDDDCVALAIGDNRLVFQFGGAAAAVDKSEARVTVEFVTGVAHTRGLAGDVVFVESPIMFERRCYLEVLAPLIAYGSRIVFFDENVDDAKTHDDDDDDASAIARLSLEPSAVTNSALVNVFTVDFPLL